MLRGWSRLILLSTCVLFFTHTRSFANENPESRGYVWSYSKADDSGFKAQLYQPNDKKVSSIFYHWNKYGALIGSQTIDNESGIISTLPKRTLWMAHPEQAKSLESFYLNILRALGFRFPGHPFLKKTSNVFEPTLFEDDIKVLELMATPITLDHHINDIKTAISTTRKDLINDAIGNSFRNLNINEALFNLIDIVEPLRSVTEDISRFDAFNLMSTTEFLKSPDSYLQTLKNISSKMTWNPIVWYFSEPELSDTRKLSIISLITHNHVAEENFIKTVVLKKGVRAGWESLVALNKLYAAERSYWNHIDDSRYLRFNSKILKILGGSNVQFMNQKYAIEVNTNSLFRAPRFQSDQPGYDSWIPLKSTYHYYGAFIIGRQLKTHHVPKVIATSIVKFLGSQYQKSSHGENLEKVSLMQSIYERGALNAFFFDFYPHSIKIKEHLAIIVSSQLQNLYAGLISELALANLIKINMGSKYDVIHIWTEKSNIPAFLFLSELKNSMESGEKVDIISVQHGPDETFIPGIKADEVVKLLGNEKVRNVLSTGCKMWGQINFTNEGAVKVLWRSSFGQHMRELGANSYIIFANNSAHWWRIANKLAKKLTPNGDWISEGVDFFELLQNETKSFLAIDRHNSLTKMLSYPPLEGRPVFGTKDFKNYNSDQRLFQLNSLIMEYFEFSLKL